VRGSLTEVIQIIGRCTRDCEGKETARFVNLIAMPDAEQKDVTVAVNDFLKAITASLLMEQVMAPSWNFKTTREEKSGDDDMPSIVVEGLKPLTSAKTQLIVEQQLDDLKASILQDDLVVRAISGSTSPENITQVLVPKVIRERYPDLNEEEVEEVRQRVLLDTMIKGSGVYNEKGEPIDMNTVSDDEPESEGNKLVKLAGRFVNINNLSINLIDTINPFQRAYEVLSKSVDAPTLRVIQESIAVQKLNMTLEQAIVLFKGPVKRFIAEKGRNPSANSTNVEEQELAAAIAYLKNLKMKQMMGLDFEKSVNENKQ